MKSARSLSFSKEDLLHFKKMGISSDTVKVQLQRFEEGFPPLEISANVEIDHGLRELEKADFENFREYFETLASPLKVVKFVPASGAASRMFKSLHGYLNHLEPSGDNSVKVFFDNLHKFAFYEELATALQPEDIDELSRNADRRILRVLLTEGGLNYGNLPKALLPFHKYSPDYARKAFDEHLVEGAYLCPATVSKIFLHFTISETHQNLFRSHLQKVIPRYKQLLQKDIEVTLSTQDAATNTVAVDLQNCLVRDPKEMIVFRPGGHGALLGNLNQVDADLVFIKNVDNVVPDHLKPATLNYKKAMAGLLLKIQQQAFAYCKSLESDDPLNEALEEEIIDFAATHLGFTPTPEIKSFDNQLRKHYLFSRLNRPIRVCGVIRSQNTGGGPYWVRHTDGSESLQLLETDQINKNDLRQQDFLRNSNYANITDLVCTLKNHRGEKFDLSRFCDDDAGFISEKSYQGRTIKAMELPGLWNGAMSDWNTTFVKVPKYTFAPVKTIFDLLKPDHQPNAI